jgi:hypothetical protein
MPTASQQLLAMAPALQQAHAAAAAAATAAAALRQGNGGGATAAAAPGGGGTFDWMQLAKDLAAGPAVANAASAGRASPYSDAGGASAGTATHPTATAAAGGLPSLERKSEPWLSVSVLESSGLSFGGRSDSESARMAAELDELLHQVSCLDCVSPCLGCIVVLLLGYCPVCYTEVQQLVNHEPLQTGCVLLICITRHDLA